MSKASDNEDLAEIVQQFLADKGFYAGDIDGHGGGITKKAWTAFVASLGIIPPADLAEDRLSPHFTLAELTHSNTASRLSIPNVPPASIITQLRNTASQMERVRELLGGRPILISSGYRSDAVNKAVGGSTTSAHRTGHAVDFTCPSFGSPAKVAAHLAKNLPASSYDQIIEEFGQWIHIGFGPGKRGQKLTARKVSGKTKYTSGIAGA